MTREENLRQGIPVDDGVWQQVVQLAARQGITEGGRRSEASVSGLV